MYHSKFSRFEDKPVTDFDPDSVKTLDHQKQVYRISYMLDSKNWSEKHSIKEVLSAFLNTPNAETTEALLFGPHGTEYEESSQGFLDILIDQKEKLPNLKTVFFGDTAYEEAMLSTIFHGDFTPFFSAYPGLHSFHARGVDLRLDSFRHIVLERLVLELSGMDQTVLKGLTESVVPELQHLELWLGSSDYGWNGSINQLSPFFDSDIFPKLKYLGLKCSEITDEIAEAIAEAPILDQIDVLDLSGGTLTDEGGESLLNSSKIPKLKKLTLNHNFMSDAMQERLETLSPVSVNADRDDADYDEAEEYRYVAVDE